MSDQTGQGPKPDDLQKTGAEELSEGELKTLAGGVATHIGGTGGGTTHIIAPDSCKETTDTGIMGCPG